MERAALSTLDLDTLKYDAQGLVTVVVQDRMTGEIRMLAHASREALEATLATRRATFWSRSRNELWVKGETSGHAIHVAEVWLDCDRDAVVYLADPHGPSCHTGTDSCFTTRLDPESREGGAAPMLLVLERALAARASATATKSYTKSLLEAGPPKIAAKVREEGDELGRALEAEPDENVVKESADVIYHLMVGLLARGLSLRHVEDELARRFGVSGHDEKASRGTRSPT
ncbi:MAG: bifunctional phosphoribosyl-AMP cyclohydrolase/phosphoribosyl-ATP diphosphatase HisIE [Sandaracinaceae bacterium]|nr:bifunctional phosphoribosyl-AMP cyclohydrolase/phosphoribosyl-ATP diphosphatase HisIE [Sandaracinaceae bacterium]